MVSKAACLNSQRNSRRAGHPLCKYAICGNLNCYYVQACCSIGCQLIWEVPRVRLVRACHAGEDAVSVRESSLLGAKGQEQM